MRAGDCFACPTAKGGEPFAGGRGIESPMGTIWASNITPDKETGIGSWTLEQFRTAMVDGVGGHGQQLYPAMYLDNCAACHFVSGKGVAVIFPERQGNAMLLGKDASPLVPAILKGASSPATDRHSMHLVMQGYADRLTDDEVAQLASLLRKGWGNQASQVSTSNVAKVRQSAIACCTLIYCVRLIGELQR